MREKKKKVIIISLLCATLFLMTAGYAAFSSVLNISGTAGIAGKWKIEVTGVAVKTTSGNAENAAEPVWSGTTATVQANLYDPGDYVEYEITVQNKGTIDAKLDKISFSEVADTPIKFTTSGITEGDKLLPDKTATLNVKIEYDSTASKVTEDVESELTITLEYVQNNGSSDTPIIPGETAADKLIATAVTTGDGLYADEYISGRYIFKGGSTVANFLTFNGENAGWRIMGVEPDGTIKIIHNGIIGNKPFDSIGLRDKTSSGAGGTYCKSISSGCNIWVSGANLTPPIEKFVNGNTTGTVLKDSELKEYLNGTYYNELDNTLAKPYIVDGTFNVGPSRSSSLSFEQMISTDYELKYKWIGKVGLITPSDFYLANSNTETCGTPTLHSSNKTTCIATNYIVPKSGSIWTISPNGVDGYNRDGLLVSQYGTVGLSINRGDEHGVLPVIYLQSNITLEGEGTETNPYTIATN